MKEEIIQDLTETLDQIERAEEEHEQKMESLEKELQEKKSRILSKLGFEIGDQVTLEIYEYRDDRIHCFAVPQTAECFIHGVNLKCDKDGNFLAPILKKKDRKKAIYHNDYLNWDLKKDGKVILSHRAEQHIIPGTYTEEQIKEYKIRLSEAQKI